MYKFLLVIVFLTFFVAGLAFGQSISGTYILNAQGVTLTLVLQQDAQGNIGGSLSSERFYRLTEGLRKSHRRVRRRRLQELKLEFRIFHHSLFSPIPGKTLTSPSQ